MFQYCKTCRKTKTVFEFFGKKTCKACRDIYNRHARNHYWRNPEKSRAAGRENAKRNAATAHAKYRSNPENREKERAYARARRKESNARRRARYAASPEKNKNEVKARKALKRGAEVCDFTVSQWQAMKERWDYLCAYCGCMPIRLTQEHILPLTRGGNHTASNIVPACQSCNSKKYNKTPEEAGMRIRSF